MKILITGGAGYLGSLMTEKLLKLGHSVIIYDTFIFGKDSLKDFENNPNLQLVDSDIRNMIPLVKSIEKSDAVIHLAAIVGDAMGEVEPKTTKEINLIATRNIADLCRLYNKRLIYPSTCSVYGERDESLLSEDATLIQPISLYGQTKLTSEAAIKESGCDSTIIRLGTLFGYSKRMRFDLAINLMAAKGKNKESITVFGGKQWRPFIHVSDAADFFIYCLENEIRGTFNVSWKNFQMDEVANIISEYFKVPVIVDEKITDRRSYRVINEKMLNTGFKTKMDITSALVEIAEAFDKGKLDKYTNEKYSNFKTLFTSKETQEKLFTLGPIFKEK